MKKRKQRIIKGSRQDDRHEKKERMHQRAKKADAIAKKRIKKEKGSAEQKTAPLMLPVLSTERSPVEGREEAPVAKHIESDFSEKKQDGKKVKNFQKKRIRELTLF